MLYVQQQAGCQCDGGQSEAACGHQALELIQLLMVNITVSTQPPCPSPLLHCLGCASPPTLLVGHGNPGLEGGVQGDLLSSTGVSIDN